MSDNLCYSLFFDQQNRDSNTLGEYLLEGDLRDVFKVTKSGNLTFHWANWVNTCEFQKKQIATSKEALSRLEKFTQELYKIKSVPVFLQNTIAQNQVTLYDLYEGFLDNRVRRMWFANEKELLISTNSCAGPYTALSYMKWFDKDIYASFVYRKILTMHMPCRQFRLGMNLPLSCHYDDYPLHSTEFVIHQINEHGVLLKIEGENNLTKLDNSEKVEFFLDTELLHNAMGLSYKEAISLFDEYSGSGKHLSKVQIKCDLINKFGNRGNINSSNADKFFLFVPYEEFGDRGYGQSNYKELFTSLLKKVRDNMAREIRKIK